MLTHFGRVADPQEHLRRYGERVKAVTAQVTQWMEEGCDSLAIQQRYEASERAQAKHDGVSESLWDLHEQINSTASCAEGIRLSLTRSS